ncbi:MAG: DMT family transporter [Clostridia bacterium]|nr:DMT family transporter [Clostridia bacterium]
MGYLLIILKSVANISEGVMIKKYNAKHSAGGMFFTGILSLFALAFFFVSDKNGLRFSTDMFPYAIAYGFIYCIAYFLTFVALSCGSFTLSMLIISYSLIFPILFGIIFLHESVSVFTCIGFALLMTSLFFVRGNKDEKENKFSVKWLISIIIVMLGNGLLAIIQKMQQLRFNNECNNEFMIIGLSVSASVLLIGGILKDRKQLKEILRYGIPYAGTAGVANGINNLLAIVVNNLLPLSIVSPVCSGMNIVVSFLSATVLFKEKYMKRQILGVVMGVLALVFLNL